MAALLSPARFSVYSADIRHRVSTVSANSCLIRAYERDNLPPGAQIPVGSYISGSRENLTQALISAAYFDVWNSSQYTEALAYLYRTDVGAVGGLLNLKKFELMLRCGLVPSAPFDSLGAFARKYLVHIRATRADVVATDFEREVGTILEAISNGTYSESVLGPYNLMFTGIQADGARKPTKVCVNPIGPDSVKLDGTALTPNAKIKRTILSKLGIPCVWIPYTEWTQLTPTEKKLYLHSSVVNS